MKKKVNKRRQGMSKGKSAYKNTLEGRLDFGTKRVQPFDFAKEYNRYREGSLESSTVSEVALGLLVRVLEVMGSSLTQHREGIVSEKRFELSPFLGKTILVGGTVGLTRKKTTGYRFMVHNPVLLGVTGEDPLSLSRSLEGFDFEDRASVRPYFNLLKEPLRFDDHIWLSQGARFLGAEGGSPLVQGGQILFFGRVSSYRKGVGTKFGVSEVGILDFSLPVKSGSTGLVDTDFTWSPKSLVRLRAGESYYGLADGFYANGSGLFQGAEKRSGIYLDLERWFKDAYTRGESASAFSAQFYEYYVLFSVLYSSSFSKYYAWLQSMQRAMNGALNLAKRDVRAMNWTLKLPETVANTAYQELLDG